MDINVVFMVALLLGSLAVVTLFERQIGDRDRVHVEAPRLGQLHTRFFGYH